MSSKIRVTPAIVHITCWCGEVIDAQIPVIVEAVAGGKDYYLSARVDKEKWTLQETWDHNLEKHGPALD